MNFFLQIKVSLVVTIKPMCRIMFLQLTRKHLLAHLINTTSILWRQLAENPQKIFQKCHMVNANREYSDILNAYKIHPSIKQIEKKFNEQNFFRKEKFSLNPYSTRN